MKLESKEASFQGTAGHKSNSDALEYINDSLVSAELKPGDATLKENQKGLLKEEDYVDQVLYLATNDEVDDVPDNDEVELRRFVEPLPTFQAHELTVCYEENSNHVVKDICVDEGLPLHDKFLFDTSMDEEYLSSLFPPEKGGEVVKDSVIDVIPAPGVPKSSIGLDDENLSVCSPVESRNSKFEGSENAEIYCEHLMQSKEAENEASEISPSNVLKMSLSLGDLPPLPEPVTHSSCHAPLCNQTSGIQQEALLQRSAENQGHENDSNGACSRDLIPSASKDSPNAVNQEEITAERHSSDSLSDESTSTVHDAAAICFESVSTPSTATGTDKFPPNDEPQQEHKTLISSRICSEPVPYSGSISMRSDSSATSTRSFAFPVLQNEWNSSPVRMAKADRRPLRKHSCWRQGILCFKF